MEEKTTITLQTRAEHFIGVIQQQLSDEEIAQIENEIKGLNEIKLSPKLIVSVVKDLDLKIDSSEINAYMPDGYRKSTLAIQIDRKNNYIEIASNISLNELLTEIPYLNSTLIGNILNDAILQKNTYILRENNCLGKYEKESAKVRNDMKSTQTATPSIDLNDIKNNSTKNIIIVDEHAYVVASYANSKVFIGTKDLAACIGIALINPEKQKAGVAHLDKPTIETYKTSLKEMFSKIIANKEDENKCIIYLIGGAHFPKETLNKNTWIYKCTLSSETLCCSVMEFIKNNYPQATIITDMFHEKRPSQFGILLDPIGDIKVYSITPVKKSDNFSSHEDFDAESEEQSVGQSAVKDESEPTIYQENLLGVEVHYQELQESSFDPNFLNERIRLTGKRCVVKYQEIYNALFTDLYPVETNRTQVITDLKRKMEQIEIHPEETKLRLTKLLIKETYLSLLKSDYAKPSFWGKRSRLLAKLEDFIITNGIESPENVTKMKQLSKDGIRDQLVQIAKEKSAVERTSPTPEIRVAIHQIKF